MKQTHNPAELTGKNAVGEGNHVTEQVPQGDGSSTLEEAIAPEQMFVTLHENGKAEGVGEKAEIKTSPLNASSPVTHSPLPEVSDVMQWEKVQKLGLEEVPNQVNTFPKPLFTNSPSVIEPLGSEEDIPPGFKGQLRKEILVAKDIFKVDGLLGNFEYAEVNNSEQASCTVMKSSRPVQINKNSSGPSFSAFQANSKFDSPELCSQQDLPRVLKSHEAHGPHLVDISNY